MQLYVQNKVLSQSHNSEIHKTNKDKGQNKLNLQDICYKFLIQYVCDNDNDFFPNIVHTNQAHR